MAEATKMASSTDIETAMPEAFVKVVEVNYVRGSLAAVVGVCGLLALCAVAALMNPAAKTNHLAAAATSSSRSLVGGDRVKIGAHTAGDISSLENDLGRHFDVSMMFATMASASGRTGGMRSDMNSGHDIVMNLEFDQDLDSILSGHYDGDIDNFIGGLNQIKGTHGQTIWLRPLHEFNGDWYVYGIYTGNNSADKFKQAYTNIVQRIKNGVGNDASIKFQLGYNCDNPNDSQDSFLGSYPGSDVVDMITCNAYNRDGLAYHINNWESFNDIFAAGYSRMQAIGSNKPLGIGEISSVGSKDGHSKPDWIRDVADQLDLLYPDVQQIDWFLENVDGGDWALNTADDMQAMRDFIDSAP